MARTPKYTFDLEIPCRNGGTIYLDSDYMAGRFIPSQARTQAKGGVPMPAYVYLKEPLRLLEAMPEGTILGEDAVRAVIVTADPKVANHADGGNKQVSVYKAYLENIGVLEHVASGPNSYRVHRVDMAKFKVKPAPQMEDGLKKELMAERERLLKRLAAINELLAS